MKLEKDNFEDDNELSRLEDEELGGDEVVEAEETELIITRDDGEEEVAAPARKIASKPAAKKPAKKAKAKKAKKPAKKSKPKKKAKKSAKKAGKKKKRR